MANLNPKYSNLPGIAFDQPDVYETNELPESDQVISDRVDDSESIEKLQINTSDAYKKFKGKTIDSSGTDFSDRISRSRRTGYDIQSGDYGLGCDVGEKETPQQTYQRLNHEFRELIEEINEIKKTTKDEESSSSQSPAALSKEVESLQKELLDLNIENILGTEVMTNISDPDGTLKRKLIEDIQSFKSEKEKTGSEDSKVNDKSSDCVTYQLYYKPELAKHQNASKVADFEQRLQKLENVIGKDTGKLSSIVGEMDHKTIVSAVRSLSAKLTLLDPVQLDVVENRLQGLSHKLSQIGEKKNLIEDSEKLSKVSQVYDIMKENETVMQTLPDIVDRMVCLEELHKQALQFSQALSELDNTQQQVVVSMKNNDQQLKLMEESFQKNMEMIKANVTNLEERLLKLKK